MANGDLKQHLSGNTFIFLLVTSYDNFDIALLLHAGGSTMSWVDRLNIAIDAALGFFLSLLYIFRNHHSHFFLKYFD